MSSFNTPHQNLSEELAPLHTLASNYYWTWQRKIRSLFEYIDPAAWSGLGRNPVALLTHIDSSRTNELASDGKFLSKLHEALMIQESYLQGTQKTWFEQNYGILARSYLVAYFSAEFGVASCLRLYSGGLGILSGDHLKAASDLGVPLVGVGLFYKRGYFSQNLTADGWQVETYPENDPRQLSLEPVFSGSQEPLVISVHLKDRQVRVRAWKAAIGRVTLYLLDTNLPGLNSKEDCEITSELYGGDTKMRIEQEMILGIGGAKLLSHLRINPTIFHMNEGHSAFVSLERLRSLVEDSKKSLEVAKQLVRSSSLFTTHTPVPAGIDIFPKEMFLEYLGHYSQHLGISKEELFSLGQETPSHSGFNMAVFALRMSEEVNAVSKLHKDVARRLWAHVLSQGAGHISSVTNGIHTSSWISDEMASLYDEYLGNGWEYSVTDADMWNHINQIPEELLWALRVKSRKKLIEYIKENYSQNSNLDPEALTIGFARRFATYKRANLVLQDRERIKSILSDRSRPVQFLFSGKAHPKDFEGKKLIQDICGFSSNLDLSKGKVVFLKDYDITLAQHLVQGVDLWLNNPRRPLEACGTSGMKVLANGGLNLSILDGWWDEAFTASTGWAIGSGSEAYDHSNQDKTDSENLYAALETQVIPEFFERDQVGIPRKWVNRMKRSISTHTACFSTSRMVMEYAQRYYFKQDARIAGRLNASEYGAESLESAATLWDRK